MVRPEITSRVDSLADLADQGLRKLIEGNQRFTRGEARFLTVCKETLADLAKGQRPFATILGCSDSRVPPELIFDANFGELFIVRVAGNVISPEVMGSLQYAGAHLRTPLFVVLGHEGCGAVKAALETKRDDKKHRSRIRVKSAALIFSMSIFPRSGVLAILTSQRARGPHPQRCKSSKSCRNRPAALCALISLTAETPDTRQRCTRWSRCWGSSERCN